MFERTVNFVQGGNKAELIYGDATVADLVNKDFDGDGVLDWEEPLWGLDPNKKETTPGTPDSTVIAKLKAENGYSLETSSGITTTTQPEKNLTETDKFARELFSTTASLSQNGAIDQTTIEKISTSLNEQIKNTVVKKVYTQTDIKIVDDNNSTKAIQAYKEALENLNKKYPVKESVLDVLKRFIIDENTVDTTALADLDPIIQQTQNILDGMVKINAPQSLSSLHLDFMNAGERLVENVRDIKLFDTDPIVAMSGITKYTDNLILFQNSLNNLTNAIEQKINN